MSFELSYAELRLSKILHSIQSCSAGVMEGERKKAVLVYKKNRDYRPLTRGNSIRPFPSGNFSAESILVLLCVTALLLLLPLILPPLPPPPFMLLLLPIGMLLVLVILAFMPSDVPNVASYCA